MTIENFKQAPPAAPGQPDLGDLSRMITDQSISHNADIKSDQSAQVTDRGIFQNPNIAHDPNFGNLILTDMQGDLAAGNTAKNPDGSAVDPNSDLGHYQRDQAVVQQVDGILNNKNLSLSNTQITDLQNLKTLEQRDAANSLADIPLENVWAQQDQALLNKIKQGTATQDDINSFVNARRADNENENGYVNTDIAAINALNKVASDFNLPPGQAPQFDPKLLPPGR